MKNMIGQHFIIGLKSTSLLKEEADFIKKNSIGGVILFKRNVDTPEQIFNLCQEIQSLHHTNSDRLPLFISIDMEGGRVHRLQAPFTQWPAMKNLGDLNSTEMAFSFAKAMGSELKSVGINLDFAPCADIFTNPKNTVIGDRAFGSDPELVSKMCSAVIRGFIKSDVIAVAKHFPGHGNTLLDSHEALPIEEKTLEQLEACELVPFKKSFRARLDMLMSSHILFKNIDPEWPVTLSKIFLTDILREKLKYRNIVITDDLGMKALSSNYDLNTIVTKSILAGCQILLFCNEFDSPIQAIELFEKAVQDKVISKSIVESNFKMIQKLKLESNLLSQTKVEELKTLVGVSENLQLANDIKNQIISKSLNS